MMDYLMMPFGEALFVELVVERLRNARECLACFSHDEVVDVWIEDVEA